MSYLSAPPTSVRQAVQTALQAPPAGAAPEPGFFEGSATAAAVGLGRAASVAGQFVGVAQYQASALFTRPLDSLFETDLTGFVDEEFRRKPAALTASMTPDPLTTGSLGQVIYGLVGVGVPVVAGALLGGGPLGAAAAGGTFQAVGTATDLDAQGVDGATAVGAGVIEGALTATGVVLPAAIGGRVALNTLLYGPGINIAQDIAATKSVGTVLEERGYTELGQRYSEIHTESIVAAVILGAAFGYYGARAAGVPRGTRAPDAVPTGDIDAALVAGDRKHIEIDTAPGLPADAAALNTHVARLHAATEQLLAGKPVAVDDIGQGGTFVPRPEVSAPPVADGPAIRYADPRLNRADFRRALAIMADRDFIPGGGQMGALVGSRDQMSRGLSDVEFGRLSAKDWNNVEITRLPSENMPYAQGVLADSGLSVVKIRAAVKKALRGERLGAAQLRAVRGILDEVAFQRESTVPEARKRRDAARAARQAQREAIRTEAEALAREFGAPDRAPEVDARADELVALYEQAEAIDAEAAGRAMEIEDDGEVFRRLARIVDEGESNGSAKERRGARSPQSLEDAVAERDRPEAVTDFAEGLTPYKVEAGDADAALVAALRDSGLPGALDEVAGLEAALKERGLMYSRVFHGSPHTFERFSLDKIGTGEGSQAYGWGLYFAENPGVAHTYAPLSFDVVQARALNDAETDAFPKGMRALIDNKGDAGAAKASLRKQRDIWARKLKSADADDVRAAEMQTKWYDDALALFDTGGYKVKQGQGGIYSVDIPDSAVERMLDWDKPLSEQAPEVQKAIRALYERMSEGKAEMNRPRWYEFKTRASAMYGDLAGDLGGEADGAKAASEALASVGIPGIKYLDQGSRDAGDGTRNFVVFDQKVLDQINDTFEAKFSKARGADAADRAVGLKEVVDRRQEYIERAHEAFGDAGLALYKHSMIEVVNDISDLPKRPDGQAHPDDVLAMYGPDGKAFIVARNVPVEKLPGLILHEVGVHAGMEKMLGKQLFTRVLDDLDGLAAKGDEAVLAARAMVPDDTPAAHYREEALAYLVQHAPEHALAKRVIAAIKAWVYRITEGKVGTLGEAEFRALAVAALEQRAREAGGRGAKREGGLAPRYSQTGEARPPHAEGEAPAPELAAAERALAVRPNMTLPTPEGLRRAGDAIAEADEAVAVARQDGVGFDAAAECFIRSMG